ncbi:hypothetical protein BJY59DRAFT_702914 [Rhodotorula toruloides]
MDRRKRQYSSHTRSLASSASHPRRRPRSSPYLAEDIENGIVVSLLPSLPQGGRTTVRDAVHDVSIRSSPSPISLSRQQIVTVQAIHRHPAMLLGLSALVLCLTGSMVSARLLVASAEPPASSVALSPSRFSQLRTGTVHTLVVCRNSRRFEISGGAPDRERVRGRLSYPRRSPRLLMRLASLHMTPVRSMPAWLRNASTSWC